MSLKSNSIKEQNGRKFGNMMHPWLFNKEDLVRDSPSRRDGMSYEDELSKRQQGGLLIFDIVMKLTSGRGDHGVNGVAATLFNRFFKVHSFKSCDFRDVAAACIFLAGKNEDQPRKLEHVVKQLWHFKFPKNKSSPTKQHNDDQCDVVTFLEEIVLKTVAFDINIDLPHQCVLKVMQHVEKGRNQYKDLVKAAYYLSTDVLLATDWTIRYSCSAIATACIKIAAFFEKIDLDSIVPQDVADTWYRFQDPTTTLAQVEAMTKEFLDIYQRSPHLQRLGTFAKINHLGRINIIASSPPTHVTPTYSSAPSQPKRIDMNDYKGRAKVAAETTTRKSFMPDVKDQKLVERELAEQKRLKAELERQRQMRAQQQEQRIAPKRAHDPEEGKGTKKEYHMKFVAASANISQPQPHMSANAMHFGQSQEPPSAYQQLCTGLKYQSSQIAPRSSGNRLHHHHHETSLPSTQQISPPDDASPPLSYLFPPPPPPPMLPRAVQTDHDELEEGEIA